MVKGDDVMVVLVVNSGRGYVMDLGVKFIKRLVGNYSATNEIKGFLYQNAGLINWSRCALAHKISISNLFDILLFANFQLLNNKYF